MKNQRMLDTAEAVVPGTEGGPCRPGVPPTTAAAAGAGWSGPGAVNGQQRPDRAVSEKLVRKRFEAEYKACILRDAGQLTQLGQLGALLRREGLYSSHLSLWRKQRDDAALAGLVPKRRGRKPDPNAELGAENQRLVRENAKLMRKLRRTEAILDVQKKLSEILGIELPPHDYMKEP
jgi:transposase